MNGDRPFASLKDSAASELARQIESLEPDATKLEVWGMGYQLAGYLAKIIANGKPDLYELRTHGISEQLAVEIAEAIAKRHTRLASAHAKQRREAAEHAAPIAPAAPQLPPLPYGAAREIAYEDALSMLHEIHVQQENQWASCMTALCNVGWSPSTSRELANVLNAARSPNYRTKANV